MGMNTMILILVPWTSGY